MISVVFPGQGSQKVGMGSDLYNRYKFVQEIFKSADEILGYNISDIIFNGPQEKLNQTTYTQPAIYLIGYIISKITPLESHILNLTIRSDYRRLGVASSFLDFVINKAILSKSKSILLEAKISNHAAKNLYIKFGFRIIGLRKDYYRALNGREDAIIFKKFLD